MIELIFGTNAYAVANEVKKRVAEFKEVHNVEPQRIDATEAEWSDVFQAMSGVSLFGNEESLIILSSIEQNVALGNKLVESFELIPSSTHLVCVASKVDKRGTFYKAMKREGLVVECSEQTGSQLVSWVQRFAKEQGGSIAAADARKLVAKVGEHQQLLASEIDKLITYNPKIDATAIERLIEPSVQDTIFELLDTITSGDSKAALAIYDRLRSARMQPIYITTMIAWQLHAVLAVVLAGNRSEREIASQLKLSPFVVQKAMRLRSSLSRREAREMIRLAAEADVRLKSMSIDQDALLRTLIAQLSSIRDT